MMNDDVGGASAPKQIAAATAPTRRRGFSPDRVSGSRLKPLLLLLAATVLAACGSPEERAANYMKKAQALYDKGDYVAAKLEAQNAAQVSPKNASAYYMLAQIAEQQQEFRVMFQRLMVAVDSDPNLLPARVKLGTLYFFAQAFDEAQQQADAATALAPEDPEVRILNARLLLQKEKIAEGIAELDAALATNPDLVDGILLRAAAETLTDPASGIKILDDAIARLDVEKSKPLRQVRISILAQLNRKAEVEESFKALIRDFPQEEQFQYELARFYTAEGRVDDAEQVMRGAVAMSPDDVNVRLGLAQFLLQMRSPDVAEQALEAFIAENPDQSELRIALGQLYEATGKADAAMAAYQELANRDPKSKPGLAARVRVAAIRITKGEFDEGAKLIEAVLADEPDNADALLIRAGLRTRDQRFDDAIADVRTALRKEPENTRALLLMARAHALKDEKVLAKDAYRRLLAVAPGDPDGSRELSALEALDKNLDVAEEILRARLKVEPKDIDASSRLINLLGSQELWAEAETEAKRLSEYPEDGGVGQFQLARVLIARGKKQEAVEAFRRALAKNPSWTLALEGLVSTLNDLGQREQAQKELAAFRQKYPDDIAARFMEGGMLAQGGDRKAAEKAFTDIVTARPEASIAWVALAGLNSDDPQARKEAYRRGLAANPGNAELGLLLGTELEQEGRYDEAIAHYQALLKANPNIDIAVNNLAALLLDHRRDAASHANALELAKRLETATNPAVLDTVGWAYYRNKDYQKAVQFLERAVAGAGEVPVLRYHLGMAYLATNNTEGARQELREAVKNARADFPGLPEAKAELEKLGG